MPLDTNDRGTAEGNGVSETSLDRRAFLGAAGATGAVGLAGCANLPGGGGGGGEGPIKIGAVFLLSGIAEFLGRASLSGAKLGIQRVNEAGGIMGREVKMISRDHENSADKANQHFKDLVQSENVHAMIGLTSSGVTLATAPTVEQLGVPFTLTDIGTPFITEHDEETYGDQAAGIPNLFRTNANTSINCYAMAKFANEELDVTRVANMGPDYAYGHQCWDYFKAYSNGLGADYEYVESQFTKVGASDMTPQINSVLSAEPDLVFTSYWGQDAVTFVRQATEQGLFEEADDVFDTLGADPTVFKSLGNSMPEGYHYSSWYWHSTYDNENNQAFLDRWKQAYEGTEVIGIPSFTGPSTFAAISMYKKAMENAQSTEPADIIGELEGMEFEEDPRGPIKIDPDSHQANAPTVIGATSTEDDVPYEGVGLQPSRSISLDRETATDLLEGSDLPPGV